MAKRLGEYARYHDPTLILGDVPGRDGITRDYVIPEPSAELGLWCQGVAEMYGRIDSASTPDEIKSSIDALNELPELESGLTLGQKLLGDVYGRMMADGVSHPAIQHCAGTVYAWIVGGEAAAERYWAGRGEASRPGNRAARRAAQRTGGSRTAEAPGTPQPGSTSGTRSRSRSRRSGGARKTG